VAQSGGGHRGGGR